jgi:hypothetical protein
MKRFTVLSAVLGVAATIGLMAVPAGAVSKNGDTFPLECDGALGSLNVATNPGHGQWTPAFVVGSNQRLIPYAFKFDFGGQIEEVEKPAPRNGRLDHCTFSFKTPDGPVDGEVWLSYTPS